MGFRVANIGVPGEDYNEEKLAPYNVSLVRGLWMTEEEILANASDADAIIGCVSVHPFTRRLLEKLKNCRIIAGVGIGYDATDVEAATRLGIAVTNVPDYCLDECQASLSLLCSLSATRYAQSTWPLEKNIPSLPWTARPLRRHGLSYFPDERPDPRHHRSRQGGNDSRTQGAGSRNESNCVRPLRARTRHGKPGCHSGDLDTLLAESDFISLHTPLNAETRGLMTYDCYRKMKKTCYFINTSRGGCVDQPGLIRALQEGLIAGAGIDVTIDEPISEENPLLGMPNVILTGHSAWYSVTAQRESMRSRSPR